jgi:hypothetical protein
MRFLEIKNVAQKVFEATRGVVGTAMDHQAGKGDSFVDSNGVEYNITNAYKFPLEAGVKRYEAKPVDEPTADNDVPALSNDMISPDDQFEAELVDAVKIHPNAVKFVKGQKRANFAVIIVELTSAQGRTYYGKYKNNKDAADHIYWGVTEFVKDLNAIGAPITIKRGANKTGTHGAVGMFPNFLNIVGKKMQVANILNAVKEGIKTSAKIPQEEHEHVIGLIENFARGPSPINPEYKANYEVQLGETVAPIALQTGQLVSGSYRDAEQKLLDVLEPGLTWAGMTEVEFPLDIAEKLIDSYMYSAAGTKVGVSSKDKKGGAAASLKGITEALEKRGDVIRDRVPGFDEKFKLQLDILDICKNNTSMMQPFALAARLNIITPEVAKQAHDIINANPKDVEGLQAIDNGSFYSMTVGYDGYKPTLTHGLYMPGYHASASLARIVQNKINEDAKTVYAFFASVLESSNMVQVKTGFKAKGEEGEFVNFAVIYPPVFEGTILFDCTAYYYATKKPSGGFSFLFKPGQRP